MVFGARGPTRPSNDAERIKVVSVLDDRTHLIRDVDYAAALAGRDGECPAVCGRRVVFAAMTAPFESGCPNCAALRRF